MPTEMELIHIYMRIILIVSNLLQVSAWFHASNLLLSGSKSYLTYTDSVAAGLAKGMQECRSNFYWDRWNCPENSLSSFYKHKPSREMSYVHAISAAGIMYVLTKNCSEGAFLKCGCDDSKTGEVDENGWMWGGCSDNIKFGEKISKQFMDTVEVDSDANSLMNLHNNEAGRKAVRSTLEKRCKCHGVSGSCTLQTCWTQLSDFSTIGRFLRKKYLTASQVDLSRGHLTQSNDFMEVEGDTLAPSKRDLVFLDESPDYCKTNDTIGYSGMVGRECIKKSAIDPTVKDEDAISWLKTSCSRLCRSCGLKVKKERVVESSNCNCKFMWCCSVKCDQCTKRVTKYTCQPE